MGYEEFLKDFVEAYINNDRKKTFEMQEPDGFLDIRSAVQQIEDLGAISYKGLTEEEFISEWQWYLYDNYNANEENAVFKQIVSSEPVKDEELYDIKEEYAYDKWLLDYVNEKGGLEKVDIDAFNEAWDEMDDDELYDTVNITESYLVTFEVEYENKGKIAQGEAIVNRLDGKEWKIFVPRHDVIMTKSEKATSSIIDAQKDVLENRWNIPQKMDTAFIVSSDSNKNYNIPDYFNNSIFIEKTKECLNESDYYSFKELDDAEWFSVLYNWDVIFCVAYAKDQPEQIGIYPKAFSAWGKEIYSEINDNIVDDMTYDEIYQVCVDAISK